MAGSSPAKALFQTCDSMTALPSEVDVAVIGAGAAGIAAARRLAAAGKVSVLVLEARGRAGARTWTVEKNGCPLDLGGEWLHSADRNVLVQLAETLGFELYHRRPDWATRLRHSGATAGEEQHWIAEREAHYWAIHRAALEPEDRPAAAVLKPGGRWNALFDATCTWGNAVELDKVSVRDNDRYEDTGVNWRVRRGYGSLLATLAEGLPIAFDTRVTRIDHRGRDIVLDTARGRVRAARIVVAAPTAILAREELAFDPVLPDKHAAANGLPLGLADKLFIGFTGDMAD